MASYEFIENHGAVIAAFGQWPSFHDGEVHRIVLDRMSRSAAGAYIPAMELHIRGWILTAKVEENGAYKVEHDSVVSFLFEDIYDLELEGFNQQNVLSSLKLTLIDGPQSERAIHVELEHCYVFSGEFSARRARVTGVKQHIKATDA